LVYYKEKQMFDPKGSVLLSSRSLFNTKFTWPGCVIQEADQHTKKDFSFGIYSSGKRTFFLCAETESDRESWIEALTLKVQKLALK
jgi:hypothetical protein